jgi:hypothetical protein
MEDGKPMRCGVLRCPAASGPGGRALSEFGGNEAVETKGGGYDRWKSPYRSMPAKPLFRGAGSLSGKGRWKTLLDADAERVLPGREYRTSL